MAKNSGTIQDPLTTQDFEYAEMLLDWSRSLDVKIMPLEVFEYLYWEKSYGKRESWTLEK